MAPEARLDGHVDLYREVVEMPRVFEWNLMHGTVLANSCMDIDGVLCLDPTDEENDDGERYLRFLSETPALLLPTAPVGWLVTSPPREVPRANGGVAEEAPRAVRRAAHDAVPGHGGAPRGASVRAIQDGHLRRDRRVALHRERRRRSRPRSHSSRDAPCSAPRRARCCSPATPTSPTRRAPPPQEPRLGRRAPGHRARDAPAVARLPS